jgi:hypothetical protein
VRSAYRVHVFRSAEDGHWSAELRQRGTEHAVLSVTGVSELAALSELVDVAQIIGVDIVQGAPPAELTE